MTWGLVATAGAGLVGGMMQSNAAGDASDQQQQMSQQQLTALKEASKWKATGTTNRYGSSAQTVDDTGRLTNASWNMSPEMQAYQDHLTTGSNQALPADFDPEAATAAQYQLLKNQQAPGVERGYSGLLSNLMGKGTLGLATGATDGLGGSTAMRQSNPQMEAFMNAVAQQDAANLTGAQSQARLMMDSDINRSNGLFAQSNVIDSNANASLDKTMAWGADQRDAALRGAGSTAAQSNLSAQQAYNNNSGSMWGSALQGLSSNPTFGNAVSGFFAPTTNPTAGAVPMGGAGGLRVPTNTGGFW